jgi:hypothetical protein
MNDSGITTFSERVHIGGTNVDTGFGFNSYYTHGLDVGGMTTISGPNSYDALTVENTSTEFSGARIRLRDGNSTANQYSFWYMNSDVVYFNSNNNNVAWQSTAAGAVTKPNQPAFSTRGTNYTQTNAWVTVKPATTALNTGSHYNSSTGVWTAPIEGNYMVMANGLAYPSGTGGSGPVFNCGWYKNGVIWEDIQNGEYYSNHTNFSSSAIIPCSQNDTLEFKFYRPSGTVKAYPSQFIMYGYLLG